ncbi:hypothetical protein COL154_014084, partial [Colletotrichum chrysophilum]
MELRKGVKFQDETPFDADAVVYNIDRSMHLKESRRKSELTSIEKVEAAGPDTVKFILKHPDATLLAQLADRAGMMMSPKALKAEGLKFGNDPVCSGPFKFVNRVQQDHITLEKFKDYWNAKNIFLDKVTYGIIPDSTVRLANLRGGDLDLAPSGRCPGQNLSFAPPKRAGCAAGRRFQLPSCRKERRFRNQLHSQPGLRRSIDPLSAEAHRTLKPQRAEHRNLKAVNSAAPGRPDDPIKLTAIFGHRLGPEERLPRFEDVTRNGTASHISLGVDRCAVPEPLALDPVDAFDNLVLCSGCREQDEAVIPQRPGAGANLVFNRGKALRALDSEGASKCLLCRDQF